MSTLKITVKLSKFLPTTTSPSAAWSSRTFATSATRPLQAKRDSKNETLDKASCERAIEAADAVKEGAREVRVTSERLRDIATNTAESVTKMTKDVTDKVSETAEAITGKAKTTVSGAMGTAKAATEFVKDKVVGKD